MWFRILLPANVSEYVIWPPRDQHCWKEPCEFNRTADGVRDVAGTHRGSREGRRAQIRDIADAEIGTEAPDLDGSLGTKAYAEAVIVNLPA